jgi:hypothetical protein
VSPDDFASLGRWLVVVGIVIAVVGASLVLVPRVPVLGHLPGDVRIERGGVTIYVPLATMLLLSIVVSLVLAFLNRR